MDSSRRAVEAYWRTKMVDGVTADEDKVAPVYKLEEICELLRSSHGGVVREVSEYVLKRLEHKSPIVKQKALRLIKYVVGKSCMEFRREMQRHSAVVRQLCHYKGHLDPLKGDALNKAVRDTANETVSAIFASDENKAATMEDISKRIQGFGNTNFEMSPGTEKKSFLSEVVGLGSTSIKQGLSSIAGANSTRDNDSGSYESPNMRRSLNTEQDSQDRYEGNNKNGNRGSGLTRNANSGTWTREYIPHVSIDSSTNEDGRPSQTVDKSREERLLDTIVTSGGVRLQPTRDAIQAFLVEASKMNQVAMCHALETKLQFNLWQVRMKAICVLDSILRRKNDEQLSVMASYFVENIDSVVKCAESPQSSLREKAEKVLSLLKVEDASGTTTSSVKESSFANGIPASTLLPDLIDTGGPDDQRSELPMEHQIHLNDVNFVPTGSPVDDLFGFDSTTIMCTKNDKNEEDPFADVSFHVNEDKGHLNNLFSGLTVDDRRPVGEISMQTNAHASDLLGMFSSPSDQPQPQINKENGDVHDLMAEILIGEMPSQNKQLSGGSEGPSYQDKSDFLNASNLHNCSATKEALTADDISQMGSINPKLFYTIDCNAPPNIVLNQAYASQPMNYGTMRNFIAQQQFPVQNLGNFNAGTSYSFGNTDGNYTSPLPDIFQPSNNPVQSHGTILSISKKEDTKAFDFISDHVTAACNPKRVL